MVRLTDRPDMTLDVYRGRKTTIQYKNTIQNLMHHQAVFTKFLLINAPEALQFSGPKNDRSHG